jgi:CDP-diglyceride synthetase
MTAEPTSNADKSHATLSWALVTVLGALGGAFIVALPCAIVWGHHGPSWPLIPLGVMSVLGAAVGGRLSR